MVSFKYEDKEIIINSFIENDYIIKRIIQHNNFYEYKILEEVKKLIEPNSICVDVGAYIGNHSIFLSKICGAQRVYSFEPQYKAFKTLEKNCKDNNINNVVALNIGLGCTDTIAKLQIGEEENPGSNRLIEDILGDIRIRRFDSLGIDEVDFVKIDTEEYELYVLSGMRNTLKKYHPKLMIECIPHNEKENQNRYKDINTFLTTLGYKLYLIKGYNGVWV